MTDLTEMWTELEKYQPYANRHGFGDAWRRMCKERTEEASGAAADAVWKAAGAMRAAWSAAASAAEAEEDRWSQHAITDIREAIELEQEDKT